jgi:hypothetical protein
MMTNASPRATYEMRICPHHDDKRPSFSVNLETGWGKCFACGASSRVDDVVPTSTKPAPVVAPVRFDDTWIAANTVGCHENTSAEIMLELRGLSADAALALGIRAHVRKDGAYVAFIYRDENHAPLYWKLRNTDGSKDKMERYPRGVPSALYNLPALNELNDSEEPIIVEGEFDVLALESAGVRSAVSVPDGAGLRPGPKAKQLLAPLSRFRSVAVAVDADERGEELAQAITAVLGARCRRILFRGAAA